VILLCHWSEEAAISLDNQFAPISFQHFVGGAISTYIRPLPVEQLSSFYI
jgi:hypothetical protein